MKKYTGNKVISGLVMMALLGCAGEKSGEKGAVQQPPKVAQPVTPINQVSTMLGTMSVAPDLIKNPSNGEFVGVGKEYLEENGQIIQPSQQAKFPTYHLWYVKIEFLKEDGSKVDAGSWNRPYGEHHLVRMTLESSAQPGKRYTVTKPLYFMYKTGSIQGGQFMSGADDKQNQIFEIAFTNKMGMPVNFQLWDFIQTTGGNVAREFGISTLMLTEPNAKHVITF